MSELNARGVDDVYIEYYNTGKHELAQVYIKSEADKVIADKDEEIDKQKWRGDEWAKACNQKDKEIAELKEKHKTEVKELLCLIRDKENNFNRAFDSEEKEIRHHKHKRCLAMAPEWRNYAAFCGMQSSCHNHRGFGKTAEKWTWKEFHAWKCVKRWHELAEKFKEAK